MERIELSEDQKRRRSITQQSRIIQGPSTIIMPQQQIIQQHNNQTSSQLIQGNPIPRSSIILGGGPTRQLMQTSTIVRQPVLQQSQSVVNYETEKRQVIIHKPKVQQNQQPILVNVDNSEFEQSIVRLQQEVHRLNVLISDKNNELLSWQQKCAHLEHHCKEFENLNNHNYTQRIELLIQENQKLNLNLNGLLDENQRLLDQCSDKQVEIEDVKKKIIYYQNIELEHNVTKKQLSNQNDKVQSQQKEMDMYRNRSDYLEQKITDSDKKISQLEIEVQKYKQDVLSRNREYEELQQKFKKEINQELSTADQQKKKLELQLEQLQLKNNEYQRDLKMQEMKYQNIQQSILEYENRQKLLSQEIERNQSQLKYKDEEIHKMNNTILDYQEQNERLKRDSHIQLQNQEEQKQRYVHLENSKKECENKIITLVNEVERLNYLLEQEQQNSLRNKERGSRYESNMQQYESKLRDLDNRLGIMSEEIERNHVVIKIRNDEIEQWKMRNGKLEVQLAGLRQMEIKINEYENRIALMSQEIERLNYQVKQRQDDTDSFKIQSQQLETRYFQLESRFQQLEIKHSQSESQRIQLLRETDEYRQQSIQYSEKLQQNSQEMYSYKEKISYLSTEIEGYKRQINDLYSYKEKLVILSQEIDRLNQIITDYEHELTTYRAQYYDFNSLKQKINENLGMFVILFAEIESLRGRVQEKQQEVDLIRRQSLAQVKNF